MYTVSEEGRVVISQDGATFSTHTLTPVTFLHAEELLAGVSVFVL